MFVKYILTIFMLVNVSQQELILNSLIPEVKNEELSNFAKFIYKEFFNDNTLIITNSYDDWFIYLVKYVKMNTVINEENISKLGKYQAYIFTNSVCNNISIIINKLYGSYICNHKAKYLFTCSNMEEIFKISSKYHLLNTNVVNIENSTIKMYTYFPYFNGSCGNNFKPTEIKWKSENVYPEKISWDMHGCPLRLMSMNMTPYTINLNGNRDDSKSAGIEVTIMHSILKRLNFNATFKQSPFEYWGVMELNGNVTMTFQLLDNNETDIFFGMIIENETMQQYFDWTVPHIDTEIAWYVPIARHIPQWKNLTVIFEPIVWLTILIVFVLNGFLWWLLGRNKENGESYNELSLCLMGSFYILLQGSFTTPKNWMLRIIVIIWSMSCLLLFTAHQCQLIDILTSPLYEQQISNIKQLIDSNLEFGFNPIILTIYSDSNNLAHTKFRKYHKPCSLDLQCMNRTAFQRDFSTMKSRRQMNYLMKMFTSSDGKPLLYAFEENVLQSWCNYYVKRGFPFLEKIDKLILLLQASGLVQKWENDLISAVNKNDRGDLEALNVGHVEGAFFLLFFGNILAACVAIAEQIYYKYCIKIKNNLYLKNKHRG